MAVVLMLLRLLPPPQPADAAPTAGAAAAAAAPRMLAPGVPAAGRRRVLLHAAHRGAGLAAHAAVREALPRRHCYWVC
jgi:hypothetical protein